MKQLFEFLVIAMLLASGLVFRLGHLDGPLDMLMWRQADTAYMARRMMVESPPEMLRPKAPYRGTNDVKAAEFPIYPATVSFVYKALGRESLPAARIVTLLFFYASLILLALVVREIAGNRAALWTAAVYQLLPLSIPFSRMVHPDFSIVCMSHLFFYAFLMFFTRQRIGWYVLAVAGATGAFLMKAPYAFYFAVPVAAWVFATKEGWTWKNLLAFGLVFVLPLSGAVWFNHVRIASEAPFEASVVYPMKWTQHMSFYYFFGTLGDRLDVALWKDFLHRLLYSVATPAGMVLGLAGFFWPAAGSRRFKVFLVALGTGLALYLLLMFKMVSSSHDYYSIPLMAPVAVACGWLFSKVWKYNSGPPIVVALLLMLLAGTGYGLYRVGPYRYGGSYFEYDWQRINSSRLVKDLTKPTDLVISVLNGRSTRGSDPQVLYLADRRGWSVMWSELTSSDLKALTEAGATIAAVFEAPHMMGTTDYAMLGSAPSHDQAVFDNQGQNIGRVLIFDLGAHFPSSSIESRNP